MTLDINKVNLNEKESSVYSELQDRILSMDDIRSWLETHKTFLKSQPNLFTGNYTKESTFFWYAYFIVNDLLEISLYDKTVKKALETFRKDFTERELLNWLFDYEKYGVKIYDFVNSCRINEIDNIIEIQDGGKNIKIAKDEFRNAIAFNKIFKKPYWNRFKKLTRKLLIHYIEDEQCYIINHPYSTLKELYEWITFTKVENSTVAQRYRDCR